MLSYVIEKAEKLKPEKIIIVVNKKNYAEIEKMYREKKNLAFVVQERQLGTADAVKATKNVAMKYNNCIILYGDVPLVSIETLKNVKKLHFDKNADMTIATTYLDNPYPYGRVKRDASGKVIKIIEEADATEEEKAIKEINVGIYCCRTKLLFKLLPQLVPSARKGEYYLTDLVEKFSSSGCKIESYVIENTDEIIGINSRIDLAAAERILSKFILEKIMSSGVTVVDPDNSYIDETVKIAPDTTIHPGTIIKGKTTIGRNCHIGPYTYIENCVIGDNTKIEFSYICGARIGNNVAIGPFTRIRPITCIEDNVRIGSFAEVKNTKVSPYSKIPHHSYVGDSFIGKNVNIGAGTITCNFDGKKKHKTVIEDDVFVGSNVNFIAPVKIGRGAVIAAGSTITEDVPPYSLAIARERQITKIDYYKHKK
jgi:bifunctional UDP-N-acetylglucosamine pyrophosphorylase/glucosamine-1-phosphate N-acetyltransferase